MQIGFYLDQSRCIGCYTCSVACKDWHDIPAGPVNWRRISTLEKGRYPDVSVTFLSLSCNHCARPSCVAACPVSAISKREQDGVVVVNQELCLGIDNCGMTCKDACPYGAPQFGDYDNAKMEMCNLCLERWAEGKKPICVTSCPMRALDAGPVAELEAKYGSMKEAEGFIHSPENKASIIFKPKKLL